MMQLPSTLLQLKAKTQAATKEVLMSKWALNYESGEYEEIERDGYSYTRGEYTYNWDDSEYRREEEEDRRRMRNQWDDCF